MAESRPSISPGTPVKWQSGSKTVFGTVVKGTGSGYQVKALLSNRISSIAFRAALAPTKEEWDAALAEATAPAPAAPVEAPAPVAAEVPVAAPVTGMFGGVVATPAAAE